MALHRTFEISNLGGRPFKFRPTSSDNTISMTEPEYGERELIEAMIGELLPFDIFLDVGAHTGSWTIPIALRLNGGGHVYALEPNPGTFEFLLDNIEVNGIPNVRSFCCAASDSDEDRKFFNRGSTELSSFYPDTIDPNAPAVPFSMMKARSIDSLIYEGIVQNPTLMKVDVEGAEIDVLLGAQFATRTVRIIIVEIHESVLQAHGSSTSNVKSLLERMGFAVSETDGGLHLLGRR